MADRDRSPRHVLVLRSPSPLGEGLASLLAEEGTLGLWEKSPNEWRAYFSEPAPTVAALVTAAARDVRCSWEGEEPVDWAARYQRSLRPLPAGRRFAILPSADLANPWPEREALLLVPGMAFGTGEHYTTSSCLAMMEELGEGPGRVLDVGCGTGILSIAARKLGASFVAACDTDFVACEVARKSAEVNGVRFPVMAGSAAALRGTFDTILANILAETLEELLPDLRRLLAPGGRLIGSGIAADRGRRLVECSAREGFRLVRLRTDGEWWTFLWARKSLAPQGDEKY